MTAAAGRGSLRAASGGTPRRLARWAAVAALGALGLALPGPAHAAVDSCSGDGPCLVVKVLDQHGDVQARQEFTADEINQDKQVVQSPGFLTRNFVGDDPHVSVTAPQALPLTAVIGNVGRTVSQVQYAEIIGPSGTAHDLTQKQLGPPSENGFGGVLSPSVWATTASFPSMDFFRPLIAGDPNDVNAKDFVVANAPQALVLLLHTSGKLLHPTVTVDRTKVRAGTPDTFRVTFPPTDGALPANLTYRWFVTPTEQIGAGPTPWRHRWTQPGTYDVYLQVASPDTSSGQSNSVRVIVCPKKGTTATCTKADPGNGPHDPGNGNQGGQNPPTGPVKGHGHHQGGHVHGSSQPQSPTTTPEDVNPSAGPSTSPGSGHTSTTNDDPGTRTGHQQGGPKAGRAVSGQLLTASAAFVVPQQRPSVTAAAAPRAPTEPREARQWKWAAILVLPLLVGLGMAGESLQLRRRLATMGMSTPRNRSRGSRLPGDPA